MLEIVLSTSGYILIIHGERILSGIKPFFALHGL